MKEILAAGGYTTVNTLGSGFSHPRQAWRWMGAETFSSPITYNNAVKEILAAGGYATINTLGSGFSYPQAWQWTGAETSSSPIEANNAVKEILAAGGYTTVNTLGSGFSSPYGVACGRERKCLRRRLRKQRGEGDSGGGRLHHGQHPGQRIQHPFGVAVDGSGNVFVADTGNNAVKEIVAAGGYTTVNILGSGFSGPSGVAVDGSGNVFVAITATTAW